MSTRMFCKGYKANVTVIRGWLFRKACAFEGWAPELAAKQKHLSWKHNNPWVVRYQRHLAHYNVLKARVVQAKHRQGRPFVQPRNPSRW